MTVYRLINAGDLPAVRVGKSFRLREDDVNRYLQTGTPRLADQPLTGPFEGGRSDGRPDGPGAVFLLTDYGYEDEFAGLTRAVVQRLAPGAPSWT